MEIRPQNSLLAMDTANHVSPYCTERENTIKPYHCIFHVAVPSDYQVQINATKFAATILRETPVDTPIIHITVTINVTHFPNLHSINMDIVRNTLTEQTFNFETGGTAVTIQYGESNPIDPAINATLAIERSIVYAQSVAVGTYDFDISVTVSAMPVGELPYSVPAQSLAEVVVEGKSMNSVLPINMPAIVKCWSVLVAEFIASHSL